MSGYLPGRWSGKKPASFMKKTCRVVLFSVAFCTYCCTVAGPMSSPSLQFQTVNPIEHLGAFVQALLRSAAFAPGCTPVHRRNIPIDHSLRAIPYRKAELAKVESEMMLTWVVDARGTTNDKQKAGFKDSWFQSLLFGLLMPGLTRKICVDLS